jgi:secretion system chaperone SscA
MTFSTQDIEHEHGDLLRAFFAGDESIAIPADVDPRDLDAVRQLARRRFDAGDWVTARDCYYMLARVDHGHAEDWLDLGLCYQRLARHEHAIFCLSWSGILREDDPRPIYHAGVSYRRIGDAEYAAKAFRTALARCGESVDHGALRVRIAQCLACDDEET